MTLDFCRENNSSEDWFYQALYGIMVYVDAIFIYTGILMPEITLSTTHTEHNPHTWSLHKTYTTSELVVWTLVKVVFVATS
jgi:hypothetical protein